MSHALVVPTPDLHTSWLQARDEFGPDSHMDGSGVREQHDLETPEGFAAWTDYLHRCADPAVTQQPGRVHCTFRWVVEDDTYLGAIALRHQINDVLLQVGGHIGYSIRPSARRRGHMTYALARTLEHARAMGLARVLITCAPDNTASVRTIERAGGQLKDTRTTVLGPTRRYWVAL